MNHGTRGPRVLIALAVVLLLIGVLGYLQADPVVTGERVYWRNGGGAVVFDHAGHVDRGDDCIVCHHTLAGEIVTECADCHDDSYTRDLLEHADLLEIEDHSCDGCHEVADDDEAEGCRECHAGAEVQAVYHQQCNGCHLAASAARFADASGQVRCEQCHLR